MVAQLAGDSPRSLLRIDSKRAKKSQGLGRPCPTDTGWAVIIIVSPLAFVNDRGTPGWSTEYYPINQKLVGSFLTVKADLWTFRVVQETPDLSGDKSGALGVPV